MALKLYNGSVPAMPLSDKQITFYANRRGMISPFEPGQIKRLNGRSAISYGTSSYGYDMRLADTDLRVLYPPAPGTDWRTLPPLDPKAIDPSIFTAVEPEKGENGRFITIPPNSFALGHTVEYFDIPCDILTIAIGKSTYARIGVIPHITPFEPEWCGHATLEISNTTPLPARVYVNEGLAQLIFLRGEETCLTSYADRQGKYNHQPAQVVMAKV